MLAFAVVYVSINHKLEFEDSHQNKFVQPHAMFIRSSKPGKPTLTFIFYLAVVLALSVCLEAKGLHLQHRDHTNLKRLIKKRAPPLVPLIGAGAAAPTFTSTDTTTVTSPTPSATQSITSETASAPEATKATTVSHCMFTTQLLMPNIKADVRLKLQYDVRFQQHKPNLELNLNLNLNYRVYHNQPFHK